jgi:hypothetical protein
MKNKHIRANLLWCKKRLARSWEPMTVEEIAGVLIFVSTWRCESDRGVCT